MSTLDDIWNRAADGPSGTEGDDALAAVILFDGTVNNGGLTLCFDALSDDQISAAIEGYRFFGFPAVADLITRVRREVADGLDEEHVELVYDGQYFDLIPDSETLQEALARVHAQEPGAFAEA